MTPSWKRCSTCKQDIAFASPYFSCSVSSCRKKRGGFVFCSLECWEAHVPMMRHRDAGAVEETAPTREAWSEQQAREEGSESPRDGGGARRRIAVSASVKAAEAASSSEVLIVVSKLKALVRSRYGMNTSDAVAEVLTDRVRALVDGAVMQARSEGRKTLLDRDFDGVS